MQQIKCVKCGTEISEGGRFCPNCGSPVEVVQSNAVIAPAPAGSMPAAQTISGGEVPKQAPGLTESKKSGKKITVASVLLSVLFSLLLIILGTGTSVFFIVRQGLGEAAIESAVSNVKLAELPTSALSGSKDKKETLPELIYDNISPKFQSYMPDRKEAIARIEDFLEEDFIQEFVAGKVNDYVTDILTDSGDGKIEVKEIMDLLQDHKRELNKLTQSGYQLNDRDFEDIENYLKQKDVKDALNDFKVSTLSKENRTAFDMIQWIGSNLLLGILLGVCVLLVVILFLVNRRFRRTMVYIGVSLVLIGGLDCVAGVILGQLSDILNDIVGLGKEFFNALFAPTRMWSFIVGGSLILVGLFAIILPQVFRKKKVAA